MRILKFSLIPLLMVAPLVGCAPEIGESDYELRNVGIANEIRTGVVQNVRQVKVHRHDKQAINTPMLLGAGTGALIGSTFGSSTGQKNTGAILGGLAGGAAGYFFEEKTRTQAAFEYIVRMDDTGQEIAFVQGGAKIPEGTRVRIYLPTSNSGNARARIVPL